jgi:phytoene desaturase
MSKLGQHIVVIGSGFAGLSASCYLAKAGYQVTLVEKNESLGGRARKWEKDGFVFDMGPSWYWMPDVFDAFFNDFGKKTSDYYTLKRLDPSYKIFFGQQDYHDIPADIQSLYFLFEQIEKGSSIKLKQFLEDAKYKYEVGMQDLVQKPCLSLLEFADSRVIKGLMSMHLLTSFSKYIRNYFSHPKLIQLLEFPVLFLGAKPSDIPALYSLMNYADMVLGTWYPMGGMHKIVEGIVSVAKELGVTIKSNHEVTAIHTYKNAVKEVETNHGKITCDIVVGGADYHHIEQQLLSPEVRRYSPRYWDKRVMAPSCLIYYIGIDRKLNGLQHHNLFFDADFNQHAKEIYSQPAWPTSPLFYVSVPSITDKSVAPENCENLFILIPVAPGLKDNLDIKERYFHRVCDRLQTHIGVDIRHHIVVRRDYAGSNFMEDYHSFKGNAYGLANTLMQTALFKPSIKNKKVTNLYYTGQLTVPGPGVPPSLISGKIVAKQISINHP